MDPNLTSVQLAREAHLRYVTDNKPGIKRARRGEGFIYIDPQDKKITDEKTLERIEGLRIPPAWERVWICSSENGHIQVTGFDEKGKKQYIYHQKWVELSHEKKFSKMLTFSEILPKVRERIRKDMAVSKLSQERILATIVWLLDKTFIRIGNEEYAEENKHFGLTTLRNRHVDISGQTVTFAFVGKSGKAHKVSVSHPRVASTIKRLEEIPGYELFQYIDEFGARRPVDSEDVNSYLADVALDKVTAKDFRTWGGTVISADTLTKIGDFENQKQMKVNIREAVCLVAKRLGNTPTVCRGYYIHPTVVTTYQEKILIPHFLEHIKKEDKNGLRSEEFATQTLLRKYAV